MREKLVPFHACCRTTAMGIMPHRDVEQALKLTLGLDIPFWPQLPHVSYYEDMYAQFSQHFPGIVLDEENKKLSFVYSKFEAELPDYISRMEDPATFMLSERYSVVYHRFLAENLAGFEAVRGQLIGPVSFGFRVVDEDKRPIIYNENVRPVLYDFIARKINAQLHELQQKNSNAFVWLDEPGLSWVFSGMSGYNDQTAKNDYRDFLSDVEGTRALHLCANVNLDYLLDMGNDLLSFDAYQIKLMAKGYAASVARFITDGGVICWGIVPTDSDNQAIQTPESLAEVLVEYWKVVSDNTGLAMEQIARQSLLAPARCCLKNVGHVGASDDARPGKSRREDLPVEEVLVERAFKYLTELSAILRHKFSLID